MKLLIAEPNCLGFVHVPVNSALLASLIEAYSTTSKIVFLAERDHFRMVGQYLSDREINIKNLQFIDLAYMRSRLSKNSSYWLLKKSRNIVSHILKQANDSGVDCLIFSSFSPYDLIALKTLLFGLHVKFKILCIMHADIELISGHSLSIKSQIFRNMLNIGNKKFNIKFLVLAPSIYRNVLKLMPELSSYFEFIDHPYIFPKISVTKLRNKPYDLSNPTIFGFLGFKRQNKGYDLFERLASDFSVNDYGANAKFVSIGPAIKNASNTSNLIENLIPQTEKSYYRSVSQITYAIFPFSLKHYKFTASGVILDAFSYAKPCICLYTPLIDDYFNRMGNIGYLCNSYLEMSEIINWILTNPLDEKYKEQQKTIMENRYIFEPHTISRKLKNIIEQ